MKETAEQVEVSKSLITHALMDRCLPCLVSVVNYETGGYQALEKVVPELVPDEVVDKLRASGCAVDLARFLMVVLAQNKSCTKCPPCRVGIVLVSAILGDIAAGKGEPRILRLLFETAEVTKVASECPFGKTAPDLVLFLLEHFGHQFEEHILNKPCQVCEKPLFYYTECPLRGGGTAASGRMGK